MREPRGLDWSDVTLETARARCHSDPGGLDLTGAQVVKPETVPAEWTLENYSSCSQQGHSIQYGVLYVNLLFSPKVTGAFLERGLETEAETPPLMGLKVGEEAEWNDREAEWPLQVEGRRRTLIGTEDGKEQCMRGAI